MRRAASPTCWVSFESARLSLSRFFFCVCVVVAKDESRLRSGLEFVQDLGVCSWKSFTSLSLGEIGDQSK